MAKQIIHVGVAVSTDGVMPGRDNILNIAAAIGDLGQFNVNVLPKDGKYRESAFWAKHPEEFKLLQKDAKPLDRVVKDFDTWLRQWQGRLIACCSVIDFWHLFTAMMEHTGLCPFGSVPIDTASWHAARVGNKTPGKVTDKVTPLAVAKERWALVSEGTLPDFWTKGKKKPGMKKTTMDWFATEFPRTLERHRQNQPAPPAPDLYNTAFNTLQMAAQPPRWDAAEEPLTLGNQQRQAIRGRQ